MQMFYSEAKPIFVKAYWRFRLESWEFVRAHYRKKPSKTIKIMKVA